MKFRVKYEIELHGEKHKGTETEAGWFLIDQQGNMYSHGPTEPIRPIEKEYYKSVIPLIKIGEEWLSIEEIEQRITSKSSRPEKHGG